MNSLMLKVIINTPLYPVARWAWSHIKEIKNKESALYDKQSIQIMKKVLKSNSNCVDVGCHTGHMLGYFIKFAPQGKHYAFEPLEYLYSIIKRKYANVNVYNLALSDSSGESTFYHISSNPGRSGLKRYTYHRSDVEKFEEVRVKTDKLDNILPQEVKIDFIKVDVEGAEWQVFCGALQTIKRHKPFILFEHGSASVSYGTTSEMLYDLLAGQCALHISLLSDWLEGKRPLRQDEFLTQVGPHYNFLAHP